MFGFGYRQMDYGSPFSGRPYMRNGWWFMPESKVLNEWADMKQHSKHRKARASRFRARHRR